MVVVDAAAAAVFACVVIALVAGVASTSAGVMLVVLGKCHVKFFY